MKASVLVGLFNKIITWLTSVFLSLTNLELMRKVMRKVYSRVIFSSVKFSSVTQSCLTLCDPMICSTLGLPVHHQLLEFTQTHVHRVGDAIQPSHPLSSTSPPAFNFSQYQCFQISHLFASGGQSIGVSASTPVPKMNTQD